MKINHLLFPVVLLLSVMLFSCKTKELPEDAVFDQRDPQTVAAKAQADSIYKLVDRILMIDNSPVELYLQNDSDKKMEKVSDFENLPPNLSAYYNLIRDSEGNIMYVLECEYHKSGIPENMYENIFDKDGNLLFFTRQSRFVSDKNIIYEKSEYYYSAEHELIKKTYFIADGNNKPIPENAKIKFNYRFPYKKYMTRKAWLEAHNLKK